MYSNIHNKNNIKTIDIAAVKMFWNDAQIYSAVKDGKSTRPEIWSTVLNIFLVQYFSNPLPSLAQILRMRLC